MEKRQKRLTSIIILTYNKLEYTQTCLESIRKFTGNNLYEIIVVDNNSSDGTIEWLKQQKDLKVILNKENLGFPKGCNQGISIANGDNILLLNNDVIVTPNWLDNLDKALWSREEVGAVGAVSNSCSYYQQIDVPYKDINEMIEFAKEYNKSDENLWYYRTKLIGFCMLIKKHVLEKVGLLDEIFTPGNFEDDDLSFRIIKEGYKLLLCKDTFIHHFGSVSFKDKNNEYSKLLQTNMKKIEGKWGFNSSYSNLIRFDLIDNIKESCNKDLNILEIGCGTGATLLEIKSRYKNANVYGIEINENVCEITKNNCDLIVGNIENMELPYQNNFFDYIILGDVLEHLNDPWKVLKNIKKYLKNEGVLIASIPNIMHVSVLKELIKGNFEYTNSGILDKTHLRFFTLREIQKLFESNNFCIKNVQAVNTILLDEEEKFIDYMCNLYGEGLREQYKAYQYIIKVGKSIDYSKYDNEEMIKLKYYLMRIDNNLDIENSIKYIFGLYEKYGEELICDIEQLLCVAVIKKEEVLNRIVVRAVEEKLYDFSINILMLSLKFNRNNPDTVYNVIYLLNQLNEHEVALNIFNNSNEIVKNDLDIKKLLKGVTYSNEFSCE